MTFKFLENFAKTKKTEIKEWVSSHYNNGRSQLFTSIDVRNAGFKVAHVDANLFPAGFNNLSKEGISKATRLFKNYIKVYYPAVNKIALVPENYSRNQKYLENLFILLQIIKDAGFDAILGSMYIKHALQFTQPYTLDVLPLKKPRKLITTAEEWTPDLLILNNDLTNGIPSMLKETKQHIIPHIMYGWHKRRKSKHFTAFEKIIGEFCRTFSLDPWLISTYFAKCQNVNFKEKKGLEDLAYEAEKIMVKTQQKYAEYEIKTKPYVFMKSDHGTYGMAVMPVYDPQEIINLNKKNRHSMHVVKHKVANTEILIQEGIPTIEGEPSSPSESMVYMLGGELIEVITRSHPNKSNMDNLNTRGMLLSGNQTEGFGIKTVIGMLATLSINFEA